MNPQLILSTARLQLRELTLADAPFVLALLNEPDFIRNIADRQVRNEQQAEVYIQQSPQASYAKFGFGLWLVQRKADGQSLGLCGLIQRDYLAVPDVGYAIMAAFSGQGYTQEAAQGVLQWARQRQLSDKLCGIVSPDNVTSKHILQKLGMVQQGKRQIPDSQKWVDYFEMSL